MLKITSYLSILLVGMHILDRLNEIISMQLSWTTRNVSMIMSTTLLDLHQEAAKYLPNHLEIPRFQGLHGQQSSQTRDHLGHYRKIKKNFNLMHCIKSIEQTIVYYAMRLKCETTWLLITVALTCWSQISQQLEIKFEIDSRLQTREH